MEEHHAAERHIAVQNHFSTIKKYGAAAYAGKNARLPPKAGADFLGD